ncbi:MAG: helix-turn-helix transcriptional regulator [Clostridia bacterium]|nr:helix-turn-helix transcriptional regulator [Clostridia bacterium]
MILDNPHYAPYFRAVERDFTIQGLGCALAQQFDSNFTFAGESHDFLEIVYVEEGNVEVVENEQVYRMRGGDMIFHAPMELHRIKSDRGSAPRFFNLSAVVSGSLPCRLWEGVFSPGEEACGEFLRLFALASRFLAGEESLGQECAEGLAAFLLRISREGQPHDRPVADAGAQVYRALVRAMHDTVYEGLSLEELGARCHVSVSYMKLLFRQYANTSPKHYYAKLRAAEAARLLSAGETAAKVADRMGFSSPGYFTVFFEKQTGVTPTAYKRRRE